LIVGYVVGRKTGWQLRDNKAKKDNLKQLLEEIQGKVDDIALEKDTWIPPGEYQTFDFNIIGIRKKEEEPLSLEEQLKIALDKEDYEKAAKIRNQLNQNKDE
jgi:hypothetical protein